MVGTCKLCLNELLLLKKSHIIPDFVYRKSGMYNEKHKVNVFNPQELLEGKAPSFQQSGAYDSNILCARCDNEIIGKYEKYASSILTNGNLSSYRPSSQHQAYLICENIDYRLFKLFLLSILFRSAISKHSLFEGILLLPENLEELRLMVYEGEPGSNDKFPFIVGLMDTTAVGTDTIISPISTIVGGSEKNRRHHRFIFGGMAYAFLEGIPLPRPLAFNETGRLAVRKFTEEQSLHFLRVMAGLE